jgi:hypothetical protein
MKIRPVEAKLFHADRHDQANSCFLHFKTKYSDSLNSFLYMFVTQCCVITVKFVLEVGVHLLKIISYLHSAVGLFKMEQM